ncbi:large-conductance mechanosensitive channel protein MscL [Psychroflexus sp. CAK57W]|uniref:large-conductance mechanosensitive channel protein MscL n=1 Tax=Psychroflexus curvus TaxID=2873595 RepID=UPI001CCB02A5|nr:large-conductance mechanosensitive channel protein MscL [Psychroflexus curvus]MBZ9627274.1 large-conductance mechanosensitive channel protein MscL [Psychroflexus curvus]MBZ9787268.1 large-conductance mechanosensitive channel protein MscL [Psychroflexus curvus]
MKIIKEFKEFAVKGNMFDMAIGIVIGTAFSKIVTSLVNDLFMPLLGSILGNVNFKALKIVLKNKVEKDGVIIQPAIELTYGNFIQTGIDFLIIAVCIFLVVKGLNRLRIKSEDETNPKVATPKDIELLAEIRDLLKQQKNS